MDGVPTRRFVECDLSLVRAAVEGARWLGRWAHATWTSARRPAGR